MIPKKIHYCWFGKGKYPPLIKKCIRSWERVLPDYELRLWNEDNFDINSIPYMKKCYELRKWAFISDYVRLHALYNEGGIYLDTDVLVLKTFDSLLNCNAFWGLESMPEVDYVFPESGVFGSVKGFHVLKEIMDYYHSLDESHITPEDFARLSNCTDNENRIIYRKDGSIQLVTAPIAIHNTLKEYGFLQETKHQQLEDNMRIWAEPIIQNLQKIDTEETIAHHLNDSSWFFTDRGAFFRFCHYHPFWMPFYKIIEDLNKRLRSS